MNRIISEQSDIIAIIFGLLPDEWALEDYLRASTQAMEWGATIEQMDKANHYFLADRG